MPAEIAKLAGTLLSDPARIEIAPAATTVERVDQHVVHVEKAAKLRLLTDLLGRPEMTRTLVFTRTKHGADKVVRGLNAAGIASSAIHGNKSQGARERALEGFKAGKIGTLVATDIAARGIDIDGISHVINYDLPHVPEAYVHRIGRTARAGAAGTAIAFCDHEEQGLLRDIERTIRRKVPVMQHDLALRHVPAEHHGGRSSPARKPLNGKHPRNGHGAHGHHRSSSSWMKRLGKGKPAKLRVDHVAYGR
jgi:ATP-dependent RNA helicase RhlE